MATNYSRITSTTTTFASMMARFGVVTVMNVDVYDPTNTTIAAVLDGNHTPDAIIKAVEGAEAAKLCTLDTLKIANISVDGPTKTVTGGQYSNPLIKFGKSARLEMQDALGNNEAIEAFCGGINEYSDKVGGTPVALHVTEDFAGPKLLIGHSFFIEQKTGIQVPVKIIFYQFLPDSIFNLTQDSEGDATVFDMNGDLLTTTVLIGTDGQDNTTVPHGVFYSIVDGK